MNCTQHTKRLEFCNGKEAKLEEKTEFLTGDVDGLRHTQYESQVPSHFDNEVSYRNTIIVCLRIVCLITFQYCYSIL